MQLLQVRATREAYPAELWTAIKGRTDVLERLVVGMYVRGRSTRDLEAALKELTEDGEGPLLSRSSVSRWSETLWEEYETFRRRSLAGHAAGYRFADAVYETLRRHTGSDEAILVRWGILSDGSKARLHLALGNQESHPGWLEHCRDLVRRGLRTPLTVTTDGAPGLSKAVEAIWPESQRTRCWVHQMCNLLDKVPEQCRPS